MPATVEDERSAKADREHMARRNKLGTVSGVYIPVCLNIISILMFLRFGRILGRLGLLGMLGEPFCYFALRGVVNWTLTRFSSTSGRCLSHRLRHDTVTVCHCV